MTHHNWTNMPGIFFNAYMIDRVRFLSKGPLLGHDFVLS